MTFSNYFVDSSDDWKKAKEFIGKKVSCTAWSRGSLETYVRFECSILEESCLTPFLVSYRYMQAIAVN